MCLLVFYSDIKKTDFVLCSVTEILGINNERQKYELLMFWWV